MEYRYSEFSRALSATSRSSISGADPRNPRTSIQRVGQRRQLESTNSEICICLEAEHDDCGNEVLQFFNRKYHISNPLLLPCGVSVRRRVTWRRVVQERCNPARWQPHQPRVTTRILQGSMLLLAAARHAHLHSRRQWFHQRRRGQ